MDIVLFPFSEYWWFYLGFTGLVLLLLVLDLGVFHKNAHAVSIKEATIWSVVWVSLAMVFNAVFYWYAKGKFSNSPELLALPGFDSTLAAKQIGLEFLTGFVIEKSLAIDNLFVFVIVFSYFSVPAKYQHRILFYGILGALIFRAVFIALGAVLMKYHWLIVIFGVFLILTGIKILFSPNKTTNIDNNLLVKLVRRMMPVTSTIDTERFFLRKEGVLYATPLLLALVFIEFTDIVFAIDSIPAIYAITDEPLVVYTSNVFAILGMRSLYFLLSGVMHLFRFLKYGLGLVLVFVGMKMAWLNELYHGKFPTLLSLAIITGIVGGSILLSLIFKTKEANHESEIIENSRST